MMCATSRADRPWTLTIVVTLLVSLSACDRILPERPDLELPPIEEVAAIYEGQGVEADVDYSGNVVEVTRVQPRDQLRRGGSLWARVGPYVALFSPATREVFETWAGIAAVRVITRTPEGDEIARATLPRNALTETRWRRSLNLLGHALQEGTERPTRIEDLAEWGERYAEYQYNPEYVPRAGR